MLVKVMVPENGPTLSDGKALQGALNGRYRLRGGKWRVFFTLDRPATVPVIDIDNRGQAY